MMIRYVIVISRRPRITSDVHRDRHLMSRYSALAPSKESAPRSSTASIYPSYLYPASCSRHWGKRFALINPRRCGRMTPSLPPSSPRIAIYDHELVRVSECAGTRSFAAASRFSPARG
jgi:hypothetical protein